MRTIAFWLALAFIFVIPWENAVVLEGVGTLSRGIGLVTALAWAVSAIYTRELRRPGLFHALIGLFVAWGALTGLWTVDAASSVEALVTNIQLAALVLILWDLFRRRQAVEAALQAYVLGAWVSAVSLLVNYFSVVEGADPQDIAERVTAIGFNANDVALILALGMPLAWSLVVFGGVGVRVLTVANVAYLPVAAVAVMLTGSRAALLAALVAVLFMVASLVRVSSMWRAAFVAGVVGVVNLGQAVVPPSTIDRLMTTATAVSEGDPSEGAIGERPTRAGGRSAIWDEGIALFLEAPIGGLGPGTFAVAATDVDDSAHNGFLAVLVEYGLIGFAFFLGIQVIVVYEALRQPRWTMALWLTVLLGLGVAILTHNWEQRKQTWLLLSLVVVSAALPASEPTPTWRYPRRPSSRWRPTSAKVREQRRLAVERRRRRFATARGHQA